jgi:hypothetical protein
MIADYERLAYDPDSIYGASKKLTTDRLRRMEYKKINPDVVEQAHLGYNVTDINYNAGLFEDALVRVLGNIKKIFTYISVVTGKRPLRPSDIGSGRKKKGGAMRRPRLRIVTDTGRRASTETAPGNDSDEGQSESDEESQLESVSQSTLNSYQNLVNIPGSIAFDPQNNTIQASSVNDDIDGYSLPPGTSVYTFGERPIENIIIGLLVDTATLIQQANTFFNGRIKKHITMLSGDNLTKIIDLVATIKREYDFFYNKEIQAYLNQNLSNGDELVNDIRNKLDKLQVDVAVATRSSAINFVGSTKQGEMTGAGRGFVPLKIHAPFRAIPTKYAL